jgi:hypothetical protein
MAETATREVIDVREACRRLANINRATFYRIQFFKNKRIPVSPGRVGILASDVDMYLHLQSNGRVR